MVELQLSFYRQGNWDAERLSDLPEVTQRVSHGVGLDVGGPRPGPPLSRQSAQCLGSRKSWSLGARQSSLWDAGRPVWHLQG